MARDGAYMSTATKLFITLTTGQYSESASANFATSESRYGSSFKTLTSIFKNVTAGCVVTVDFGTTEGLASTVRGFQIIGIE